MAQGNNAGGLTLHGFDSLIKRFESMPAELGVKRKLLGKALRAGAKPIQAEAKVRAPYSMGRIGSKRSPASKKYGPLVTKIKVAVVAESADGAEAHIGLHSFGLFYGRFAEMGTAHQPARPWLGPSFEAKQEEALAAVAKVLDEGIQGAFYEGPEEAPADIPASVSASRSSGSSGIRQLSAAEIDILKTSAPGWQNIVRKR